MDQLIKQLSQWDIGLLRFIHQQRIETFDGLLSVCSWLTTYISFALMIAVFLLSLQRKSKALRTKSLKLLSIFTVSALISFLIKNIIFRERPFITYPDIQKLSEAGSSSFPSGHTMEVFAMACGIALLFPQRRYVLPAYVWAFLIAYSRMALGVHYPFDVLGGMVLGTVVGVGVVWGWGIRGWGDGGMGGQKLKQKL